MFLSMITVPTQKFTNSADICGYGFGVGMPRSLQPAICERQLEPVRDPTECESVRNTQQQPPEPMKPMESTKTRDEMKVS